MNVEKIFVMSEFINHHVINNSYISSIITIANLYHIFKLIMSPIDDFVIYQLKCLIKNRTLCVKEYLWQLTVDLYLYMTSYIKYTFNQITHRQLSSSIVTPKDKILYESNYRTYTLSTFSIINEIKKFLKHNKNTLRIILRYIQILLSIFGISPSLLITTIYMEGFFIASTFLKPKKEKPKIVLEVINDVEYELIKL